MTDQESERSGGTQPGLKKSDLLTRQTGDGSFEFIVESDVSESYGFETEAGAGLHHESYLPVRPRDKKPVVLIGVGVLLLMLLTGAGILISKPGNDSAERGTKAMDQEVAGFRPYGGGEAPAREERTVPERKARLKAVMPEPVEEPQDKFMQEVYEEEPSNVEPEPETMQETEWQVGENEQVREEEELPAPPIRSIARDRINLQQIQLQGMDSERIREVVGREGREGRRGRQLERVRRSRLDDAYRENQDEQKRYEAESQVLDEEHFEEPGAEEEYYEEEALDDEIY